MTHWLLSLTLLFTLTFSSCKSSQQQISTIPEQPISEIRIRQIALQYRDQWLAKNNVEQTMQLEKSAIKSVKETKSGWHVIYSTVTGDEIGMEEGLHIYYLHVYLTSSGDLDKVVRGPDEIS